MRIKNCQVCGKEYDACKSPIIAEGFFNWTEVACSPKCAIQYMANLEAKDNAEPAQEEVVEPVATPKKRTRKTKKSASVTEINEEVDTQP